MTLIRALGRTMLASYFIASGIKTARKPAAYVVDAQPVADKIVPAVQKYAPRQIAGVLPDDTVDLVRLSGIAQVAGGVMLATGKGRRLGASVLAASIIPSTLARHPYWARQDAEQKAADKTHFFKNLSLLGGVIIASRDTEGQPGLRWRAATGAHALTRSGSKATKSISKSAGHAGDAAVAGGVAVLGGVLEQSRRARKQAAKATRKAAKKAAKRSKPARRRAQKQAEKLRGQAQKQARAQAKKIAKQRPKVQKKVQKQVSAQAQSVGQNLQGAAKDLGRSTQSLAQNITKEVGKNIELGHN